jgi:hypothetical protein
MFDSGACYRKDVLSTFTVIRDCVDLHDLKFMSKAALYQAEPARQAIGLLDLTLLLRAPAQLHAAIGVE